MTLMSDPRVRRGTTYNSNKKEGLENTLAGTNSANATAKGTKRIQKESTRSTYQFQVASYAHEDFDLEKHLTAPEPDKSSNQSEHCQTDEFLPLPPPAEYVPRKTGVDASTQVENARDLFNFDLEVRPMVEVITRKTIEQALFEISSENELKTLEGEIYRYGVEAEVEAAWIRSKEKETIEDNAIKEKERSERSKVINAESATKLKVAAVAAMQQIVPNLFESISQEMFDKGVWKRAEREAASHSILPQLYSQATAMLELRESAASIVDGTCNSKYSHRILLLF